MKITDMYLAATLLSYGAKLEEIDRSDPRRQQFDFSGETVKEIWVLAGHSILRIENPTFEKINTEYVGGTLVFPPTFVDCVKKVKSAIHGA
jgi:hypothetical protein